jgi:hypothetical protein
MATLKRQAGGGASSATQRLPVLRLNRQNPPCVKP